MRNQQIKKVNRIFFSGQDEEKQKWIEQMAAEGWQLISGTSFVYSFQKIASENEEYQSSYKSILGLDLQKSMPLFQDSNRNQVPLLNDQNYEWKTPLLSSMPKSVQSKLPVTANNRHRWLGTVAILLFIITLFTKIAIFSTGDFVSLFKWQIFSGILLAVFCLVFGGVMLFKTFLKILALECKSKD
jgi:hypothetical protein